MSSSIARQPGMGPLLVMTCAGFSGYAVLLPVAPLWAVHGGASTGESGLVNGVLLAFTVLTQLLVPGALRRWGWGPVLASGMVLLGVPAALYAVSSDFVVVLGLSAVRGIGFGVLTVCGSAAVAGLVAPERRGQAVGVYGLAIAVPHVLLLPAGPWIAQNVGFGLVFAISALPLAGVPAALRLARVLGAGGPALVEPVVDGLGGMESGSVALRRLLRPTALLLSVTLAGGALITFAPQMVGSQLVATGGLFVMGLLAALARWQVGALADRYGAEKFLVPLLVVTVAGAFLVAWSLSGGATSRVTFLCAAALLGLGYGALQNLTLVVALDSVAPRHHHLASSVWNIGFDTGTALGSVVVGVIATGASFSTGFVVAACVIVVALPVAALRSRTARVGVAPPGSPTP